MSSKIFPVLILIFCLFSCQPEGSGGDSAAPVSVDLKTELPGTWEAISIKVTVNSANNTDSSYVFEVREENWEQLLGVKPVKTYFELDSKYRQEFRDTRDSLANLTRGLWNTFGDTLMLMASDATYQYHVNLQNGIASFSNLMDWDGDGVEDDTYVGMHRYISKQTN